MKDTSAQKSGGCGVRSAAKFVGYQKETPTTGPRVERLTALYALPKVGDYIILRQIKVLGKSSVVTKLDGTHSALERMREYITVDGKDMIFRVRECPVERILYPSNYMIIDRVFPNVPRSCSIPTRWIVTGSFVCQTVEIKGEHGEYEIIDSGRRCVREVEL